MAVTKTGVTYNPTQKLGHLVSSADYSAAQTNVFMVLSADHTLTTAGAGVIASGVRVNKPNTGEAVELIKSGTAPLKLGGVVTYGDLIKSDGSGYGVKSAGAGDHYLAQALQSGVSGDEIEVDLDKNGDNHA